MLHRSLGTVAPGRTKRTALICFLRFLARTASPSCVKIRALAGRPQTFFESTS